MLSNFVPHVQTFLEKVLKDGRVGVGAGVIGITNPKSGSPSCNKNTLCDNFIMVIPYGGQTINWEVMFLQNHPEFPPDFIFDDRQFMPDLEDIKSLCNWDPDDPAAFLLVVQELIDAYRRESIFRLEGYSRLHFEYTSLLQQPQMTESDIEVLLNKKNRNSSVSFLIKLNIDFSKLPPLFSEDNPKEDSAILLVTFQSPDGGKITPQLFLSPGVEQVLGGISAISTIPAYPVGGCLMEYVPCVIKFLSDKVDQLVLGFEKRKDYFSSFMTLFGRGILEYDSENYSKLGFLFEWNDFFFIVHITIPQGFPQNKPELLFQSIYSCVRGTPFSFHSNDYPYSPRWTGAEMAERTRLHILKCVPQFQRNSVKDL